MPLYKDQGIVLGSVKLAEADKVAEEHERNVRLFLLLLQGLRALERRPTDAAAVAEAFLLRLLGLSGFAPALAACAVCGTVPVHRFSHSQGGAVCEACEDRDSVRAEPAALAWLDSLTRGELDGAGEASPAQAVRGEARALLYGFAEYHLERRMRSLPLLARS